MKRERLDFSYKILATITSKVITEGWGSVQNINDSIDHYLFEKNVEIEPFKQHTVSITVKDEENSLSYYGKIGHESVKCGVVTFFFTDSKAFIEKKTNGTNVLLGQIPRILFRLS